MTVVVVIALKELALLKCGLVSRYQLYNGDCDIHWLQPGRLDHHERVCNRSGFLQVCKGYCSCLEHLFCVINPERAEAGRENVEFVITPCRHQELGR